MHDDSDTVFFINMDCNNDFIAVAMASHSAVYVVQFRVMYVIHASRVYHYLLSLIYDVHIANDAVLNARQYFYNY